MFRTIRENVLLPIAGRIGTATATVLAGRCLTADVCIHADTATQLGIGVTIVALLGFDLGVSWLNRRMAKKP